MNGDTNITFVESFTKEVGFLKKAVTPDELWMNFKSFLAIIELPHWLMGLLQWSRSQYATPPGPNVNVYDEQWYSHLQNQLKVFLIFTQQVTLISYIYWQQLMWSASVPIMYVHLKKLSVVCFNILKWIEIKLNQNILVRFKHLHWLFLLHLVYKFICWRKVNIYTGKKTRKMACFQYAVYPPLPQALPLQKGFNVNNWIH